jgi:DNA-binding transcriptional MerR regulator
MRMDNPLPPIPAKRYFTIGEVSELCAVKPYVLRYWEQEFTQLKPVKRRGNRRYYQHHEVLLIRRIRELLYDQGFTISGARNKLGEPPARAAAAAASADLADMTNMAAQGAAGARRAASRSTIASAMAAAHETARGPATARVNADGATAEPLPLPEVSEWGPSALRAELEAIRDLLSD